MDINKIVMRLTGTEWGGSYGPPEAKTFRYHIGHGKVFPVTLPEPEYQVFASGNDGFELWMGWQNNWDNHLRQEEVRALFWWILIEWFAKARWFGLRRPIYYWALKRHANEFRKVSK